jgi:hypothetical protein
MRTGRGPGVRRQGVRCPYPSDVDTEDIGRVFMKGVETQFVLHPEDQE